MSTKKPPTGSPCGGSFFYWQKQKFSALSKTMPRAMQYQYNWQDHPVVMILHPG